MLTPAEIAELRHAVQFKQRPVDGAPRIGETRLQITQTPKYEALKQQEKLEKMKRSHYRARAMVDSATAARDVRWPESNWEIPDQSHALESHQGVLVNS